MEKSKSPMGEQKRSKRHRRNRNHISSKDLVNSNTSNVSWARKIRDNEQKRWDKNPVKIAKGMEKYAGRSY